MKSKNEKVTLLPIFQGLKVSTEELLKAQANKIYLKKSEILFREREEVEKIYIIFTGKVIMYRNNAEGHKKVIYILDRGQMINEVIFDGKPASINCEAFEDAQIIWFYRDEFLNIMEQDFDLTKRVVNMMSKKIRRLYRQLKNTVPIRVDKKVAAKLWKLSRDYGIDTEEGTLIDLKITVTSLAEMLGSSRETISRAVKLLDEKNLIKYKNRKMIVDKEKLSKYFKNM